MEDTMDQIISLSRKTI